MRIFTSHLGLMAALLATLCCTGRSVAQTPHMVSIHGTVLAAGGDTVPFSTIYLRERMMGTAAGAHGEFYLSVEPGHYSIVVQSMGYTPLELTVDVEQDTELNPVLSPQQYALSEVTVGASGEDPAMPIMRKAIAMAPLHLKAVRQYDAQLYTRGSFCLTKIPFYMKPTLDDIELRAGDTYTIETAGRIHFEAPNQYEQTIISERNSLTSLKIGDDANTRLAYLHHNIYDAKTNDFVISPLAPNAFAHYRFEYTGSSMVMGCVVNHIRVIPRRVNKRLYSGTIHIIDGLWALAYTDLTLETVLGRLRFKQTYSLVRRNTWLPVIQDYGLEVSALGTRGHVKYISTLKYERTDIDDPTDMQQTVMSAPDTLRSLMTRRQKRVDNNTRRLNQILAQDDISKRQMRRSVRIANRRDRLSDTLYTFLEINTFSKYLFNDDHKTKLDSTQWRQMRTVPLTADESRGFERKAADRSGTDRKPGRLSRFAAIAIGNSDIPIADSLTLRYSGIVAPGLIFFHPVTGFVVGQSAAIVRTLADSELQTGLTLTYGTEQKKTHGSLYLMWTGASQSVRLSAGTINDDWKGDDGDAAITNSFTTLFLKKNFKSLVQKKMIRIDYTVRPVWGMEIGLHAAHDELLTQENRTDFSIIYPKRSYGDNTPFNKYVSDQELRDCEQTTAGIDFAYTPRLRYHLDSRGRRVPHDSNVPTMKISLRKGLGSARSQSGFTQLTLGLEHRRAFRLTNSFCWDLQAGTFFNAPKIPFAYWQHFSGSDKLFGLAGLDVGYKGFVMFRPYEQSTRDWFVKTSAYWQTQRLLLKHLPVLGQRMWTEELYLKQSVISGRDAYTEVGYGLGQILLLMRATCFVSFRNVEFDMVRLRLAFSVGGLFDSVR